MRALILVDIQKDFLPGGALAVEQGHEIIPIVSQLLKKDFDVIVASKDWHPPNHGSFAAIHGKQPGEKVNLFGLEQILWPVHCVQQNEGAAFAEGWDATKVEKIFYKGTDKDIDSYSTFFDNGHLKSTGLENYLIKKNIEEIYFAGLATDYCVKYSVFDACRLGFKTYVVMDACRGVNLNKSDDKKAFEEMRQVGAQLIHSSNL